MHAKKLYKSYLSCIGVDKKVLKKRRVNLRKFMGVTLFVVGVTFLFVSYKVPDITGNAIMDNVGRGTGGFLGVSLVVVGIVVFLTTVRKKDLVLEKKLEEVKLENQV